MKSDNNLRQGADFEYIARAVHKHNRVYQENLQLPWQDLPMPEAVLEELLKLPKSSKLLFPGCGLGQHANQAYDRGYLDVTCTDISNVAIDKVRKAYPHLHSYSIPTQYLRDSSFKRFFTFDIHNLHQMEPAILSPYLRSLQSISLKLLISWVYEPERGQSVASDVPGVGMIFHHEPGKVGCHLERMGLKRTFGYDLPNNPKFFKGNDARINKLVCQVYEQE